MHDTKKLVNDILEEIVSQKFVKLIKPEADLRNDLGIDSIKMIAISAMLMEQDIDIFAASNKVDFMAIETVQDIIDCIDLI